MSILKKQGRKTTINRSVKAILKHLLNSDDSRTSFTTSYLVTTRFSPKIVSNLPVPKSTYSRLLLNNLGLVTVNPLVDEIAPLLGRIFRIKIPAGFNFRTKLNLMDPKHYSGALRYLQMASWYVNTSPTYFVNHIHNFNHVLLFFLLNHHKFVSKPVAWRYTFRELSPGKNATFSAAFPTIVNVFSACGRARNVNLSSHPYDELRSRYSKLVTYPERNRLIALLRAAYKEFIAKA